MNAHVAPEQANARHTATADIERALIGACMNYPTALAAAAGHVSEDHFVEAVHRQIWEAMAQMAADGRRLNPVTIIAKLGNEKISDDWSMQSYVSHCAADTFCPAVSVVDFAKLVREHWALRAIIHLGTDAQGFASVSGTDPRKLIAELMQALDETRAVLDSKGVRGRSIGEGAAAIMDRVNQIICGEMVDHAIPTGIKALDRKLNGGMKGGELIVVAGRPGMGKTTVAVSLSRQMAQGRAGGFFSLEMPEEQISSRFVADEIFTTGQILTASQIIQGQVSDQNLGSIANAERALRDMPLLMDYSASLSVGELSARTRTFAQRFERDGKRLGFVVIDYLKFLKASERYRGQRHYEIGEITAGLKALAKDLSIAVILLAQLNREVEKTADRRPELSHLRESGDIESDADVVMFLYREAYYLANDPRLDSDPDIAARLDQCRNTLEVIIAKQRMGATCKVTLFCHPGASAVRDQ